MRVRVGALARAREEKRGQRLAATQTSLKPRRRSSPLFIKNCTNNHHDPSKKCDKMIFPSQKNPLLEPLGFSALRCAKIELHAARLHRSQKHPPRFFLSLSLAEQPTTPALRNPAPRPTLNNNTFIKQHVNSS
jgi:hypothetical protein